jgi:pyrroloquinoline-quinone synthase
MSREVIADLDPIIAERSMLKHPFYQAWTAGTLTRERLQNYAVEYYPHVAAFPRYLSAIHSRCADMATRQAILENLIEEERGAENHPELWLALCRGDGRLAGARPRCEPVSRECEPGSRIHGTCREWACLERACGALRL